MSWLKEWDHCVFKNSNSGNGKTKMKNGLKRTAPSTFGNSAAGTGAGVDGQQVENKDPLKRPLDKVNFDFLELRLGAKACDDIRYRVLTPISGHICVLRYRYESRSSSSPVHQD